MAVIFSLTIRYRATTNYHLIVAFVMMISNTNSKGYVVLALAKTLNDVYKIRP